MTPKIYCNIHHIKRLSYPFITQLGQIVGHVLYCPKCKGCRLKRQSEL